MTEQTSRRVSLDINDAIVLVGAVLLSLGLLWIHPALLLVVAGAALLRQGTT